jgi:hypothetical protein
MPDRTKIVFSHGEEVAVHQQVQEVRRRLSKDRKAGQAFTKLKTDHDTDVYVAVGQVAYIEQVPDGLMGRPIFAKKQSRKQLSTSGVRRPPPNRAVRPGESRRGEVP